MDVLVIITVFVWAPAQLPSQAQVSLVRLRINCYFMYRGQHLSPHLGLSHSIAINNSFYVIKSNPKPLYNLFVPEKIREIQQVVKC